MSEQNFPKQNFKKKKKSPTGFDAFKDTKPRTKRSLVVFWFNGLSRLTTNLNFDFYLHLPFPRLPL